VAEHYENVTGTSLHRPATVVVFVPIDEPDSEPSGSGGQVHKTSPEFLALRRSSRMPKLIRRRPDDEWTAQYLQNLPLMLKML